MALPAAAWRLIVAFVVVFATYSAVKSFLYLQVSTSTAVNDLCTNDALLNYEEGQLTWNGVTMDAADWRDLCTLPSQLQFDRFLWFVSDGFPVSFAFPLLEVFEDHGVGYTIEIPGAKYSHAIYTSFLTGQPPTNYKGEPIAGDSLLASMKRAKQTTTGFPLYYVGPEWSFLAVTATNYSQYFDVITEHRESLGVDYRHLYPFFFESPQDHDAFVNDYLPRNLARSGRSLVAHSAVLDHRQHGDFHYNHGDFASSRRLAERHAEDMEDIKRFIDTHPEYLLIYSTDHGVDEHGPLGYKMHGTSAKGNEGFIFFYNPRLAPMMLNDDDELTEQPRLDIVDVCATIAKYLKNVDIPANSVGKPATFATGSLLTDIAGGAEAAEPIATRTKVLKQALLQKVLVAKEKRLSLDIARIERLVAMPNSDPATRQLLEEYLEEIKHSLYGKQVDVSIGYVVGSVAVLLTCLVLIGYHHRGVVTMLGCGWVGSLVATRRDSDSGQQYTGLFARGLPAAAATGPVGRLRAAVREAGYLVLLYSGLVLPLMFCWWKYGPIHNSGLPLWGARPALAALLCYYLDPTDPPQLAAQSASLLSWTALSKQLRTARGWLVANELINFFVHTASLANRLAEYKLNPIAVAPWGATDAMYFVAAICTIAFYTRIGSVASPGYVGRTMRSNSKVVVGHILLSLVILGLMRWFDYIDPDMSQPAAVTTVMQFHVVAWCVYVLLALQVVLLAVFRGGGGGAEMPIAAIAIPLSLLLFFLKRESWLSRLYIICFDIQYFGLLVPVAATAGAFAFGSSSTPDIPLDKDKDRHAAAMQSNEDRYHVQTLLPAAVLLYALAQAFFSFHQVVGDAINLEVYPFSGSVGIVSYDVYPSLSAVFMTFHKYGLLVIFTLWWWLMAVHCTAPVAGHRLSVFELLRIDLASVALLTLFGSSLTGFYLTLRVLTRWHAFVESAAMVATAGTMTACFLFIAVLHYLPSMLASLRQCWAPRKGKSGVLP